MILKAKVFQDFFSVLYKRGSITEEEYNLLSSACELHKEVIELQNNMESIIDSHKLEHQDQLSNEYKEHVIKELIDVNLKYGNYDTVKLLSDELFGEIKNKNI